MKKATASAPANLALVKYWGNRGEPPVPLNPSLSLTLSKSRGVCTIEPADSDRVDYGRSTHDRMFGADLNEADDAFAGPVLRFVDRLRDWFDVEQALHVRCASTIPIGCGLASSASGFMAVAAAFVRSLDRKTTPDELSVLARHSGSGSASRSAHGGFVGWPDGRAAVNGHEDMKARQLFNTDHYDLSDVVALIDTDEKDVSSRSGHDLATTSPLFEARLRNVHGRFRAIRDAIADRSFEKLAPLVEREAESLHAIARTANTPVHYYQPGTIRCIKTVQRLRRDGLNACYTIDAGPNVHVVCEDAEAVQKRLVDDGFDTLVDHVGDGVRYHEEHLS